VEEKPVEDKCEDRDRHAENTTTRCAGPEDYKEETPARRAPVEISLKANRMAAQPPGGVEKAKGHANIRERVNLPATFVDKNPVRHGFYSHKADR
jgi:hypothetical protein